MPKPKFLLDENVKRRLEQFIKSEGFDVILAPQGVSDAKLALLSKLEKYVLVTNDSDFTDPVLFPKENIFSIIWLRIPQHKSESLFKSFSRLLRNMSCSGDFEGHLIVLKEEEFEVSPIPCSESLTR